MRNLSEWLHEYSKSHQNPTNQKIHKVCVPAIYFTVVAILWCIPLPNSIIWVPFNNVFWLVLLPILGFYLMLGIKPFMVMLTMTAVCVAILLYLDAISFNYILEMAIGLFIVAWILQFWGHKIEGAKPSFINDLAFLLIGPLWVFNRIFKP